MYTQEMQERRPGDEGVTPHFFKNEIEKVTEDGYEHVELDYIEITQAGKTTPMIIRKVKEDDKDRFAREWFAFENNKEQTAGGTDVGSLPTITVAEIKVCKSLNIHTVEQLSSLVEMNIKRVGLNGRRLVNCAKKYLAENTPMGSAILIEKDELIAALRKEIEELKAKPKRTRRKKVVEDESINDNTESGEANTLV